MKIIDLLNKIANGEEVPKKIKFCFRTFEYNNIDDYLCIDKSDYSKEDYCNGYSIHKWIFGNNLNTEVEILEEEKKIPEKINNWTSAVGRVDDSNIEEYVQKLFEQQTILYFKINSIIDYLKSKGE